MLTGVADVHGVILPHDVLRLHAAFVLGHLVEKVGVLNAQVIKPIPKIAIVSAGKERAGQR